MNAAYFIFRLLHICNLPTLVILTPPYSPCTPTDYAHLFTNYEKTLVVILVFLLPMPKILMIVQILLMIRRILLLIHVIFLTYHL